VELLEEDGDILVVKSWEVDGEDDELARIDQLKQRRPKVPHTASSSWSWKTWIDLLRF